MPHIVLIPTMSNYRWFDLIKSIIKNDSVPSKVVVINNSLENDFYRRRGNKTVFRMSGLKIEVFCMEKNIGVNAAWNIGLEMAEEIGADLTLMNDDIKIKNDFFARLEMALESNQSKSASIICPTTTHDLKLFENLKTNLGVKLSIMSKREGWTFTIKRNYIKKIKKIPDDMFIFCGDDWFWHQTVESNNGIWVKDYANVIYHEVGATLKSNPDLRRKLLRDKRAFNKHVGRK